ncbi:hypothetical protein [Aeromonas phage MJG]|uniref:Uncharacterized protein n=1 Tax=Aeromonas phage MJG TaxID=2510451 RepID=A0A5J6A0H7_9CAUD|nr:hypothetical protein [Aeromonas phage MJG]
MKETVIAILVIVLLAAFGMWQYERASDYRDELRATKAALDAEVKLTNKLKASIGKTLGSSQSSRVKTKEALDEAPSFRDTAVPVPVATSLCQRIHCKGAG